MENTVLLFGGASDERLVSVASAQNLVKQTDFSELWFIRLNGEIVKVSKPYLLAHARAFEVQFEPQGAALAKSIGDAVQALKGKAVFLGLHGTEGEDGTIQKIFETNQIPFTGSGSDSSRSCFNKVDAKNGVSKHGLPLAPQATFTKSDAQTNEQALRAFFEKHGSVVAKPAESGSSFGLHILREQSGIAAAAQAIANSPYDVFLMESFITGRELTVGVVDGPEGLRALVPSEVLLAQGHAFDYKGKYLGHGSTEITPADLNEKQKAAAQKLAIDAHKALGCFGYTRTDMILTDSGPVFLETNTLPGLSGASFVPQQLAVEKTSVKDFVEGQLKLAKQRYR